MPQRDQDGKGEVSLPQGPPRPFVHPGVPAGAVDHAAAAFNAARAQRQRANVLPKVSAPVAGGPTPPIPNLAGAPQHPGMTMAQHAAAERGVRPAPAGAPGRGFVEPAITMGPNQVPSSPAQLGILPTDELPAQAKEDPEFVNGTGAMFAANQPRLAQKYGVIRRGKFVPPQQLSGQQRGAQLRPETLRDIETLQELQHQQHKGDSASEPTAMGRAAGEVGVPGGSFSEDDKKNLQESINNLDEFDFDQWRQSLMRDILNNDQQKKIIEARLKPMDVGDLITSGFLVQKVEIVPGKFWVEFKTLDGETDLALKRLIMEDSRSVEVSDRYYLDKFSLMSVAAVVHRINDRVYPDFVDSDGHFHDDKFRAKFRQIIRLPMPMLTSLGANALWFDIRVRKLFVATEVGNG